MKIYTKMGDSGSTMLTSGEMVAKNDLRIDAYGSIDELNSHIGLLASELQQIEHFRASKITQEVEWLQNRLFDMGSELATPQESKVFRQIPKLQPSAAVKLELMIDSWSKTLPPLTNFILPGGNRANAQAHICRAVCRRAERRIIHLKSRDSIRPEVLTFINRLSDWFFVLAREISHRTGACEVLWEKDLED
jgi:cob(I)alamin adenosyltransferase